VRHLGYKRAMSKHMVVAALVILASCDDSPTRRPTTANDLLWRVAPEDARGGIVISPYAVGMIEDATLVARDFLAKAGPELQPLQQYAAGLIEQLRAGGDARLADLGLARNKGAALFFGPDGKLATVVLPIADRDAFVARANGTRAATADGVDQIGDGACKVVGPHYACARSEALLATLGKGRLVEQLPKLRARGDIEVIAALPGDGTTHTTLLAAAELERGAFVIRGLVLQPQPGWVAALGEAQRPKTAIGRSAGFGVIDLRPLAANVPPLPLTEEVTLIDVVGSLAGPLSLTVPAGVMTIELEQPLSDPAPIAKVLARCGDVPALAPWAARIEDGTCTITIREAGLDLALWVEGSTLRVGKRGVDVAAQATPVPMPPAALEMATGTWSLAMWGRGSMFAPTERPGMPDLDRIDPGQLAPIRAMSLVNELGFAVKRDGDALRFLVTGRTAFANPRELVAKLVDLTARDALANTASAKAGPIADAHRASPFAHDHASGQAGLLVATYLIAAGSSFLAPLFADADADADAEVPTTPVEAPPEGWLTQRRVEQYATAVYPEWRRQNPKAPCPTMPELASFVGPDAAAVDEWGRPLTARCDAKGNITVTSPGVDGTAGTDDDIQGSSAPE
jgi:hypothetical protein